MLQHYWWGERALLDAQLPLTVRRANFFMNHLLKTDVESIEKEGWFSNPLGSTRNSFVSTNDIGEAAATCFVEGAERHANKFYDLTGPEPQSMDEIAAVLGDALGKKLEYRPQVPPLTPTSLADCPRSAHDLPISPPIHPPLPATHTSPPCTPPRHAHLPAGL